MTTDGLKLFTILIEAYGKDSNGDFVSEQEDFEIFAYDIEDAETVGNEIIEKDFSMYPDGKAECKITLIVEKTMERGKVTTIPKNSVKKNSEWRVEGICISYKVEIDKLFEE